MFKPQPQPIVVRDTETGQYRHYTSAADAIIAGIREVQQSGGGSVWIHRPGCDGVFTDPECPCDPVPVNVDAEVVN